MKISAGTKNLLTIYVLLLITCVLLVSTSIFIGRYIELKSRSNKDAIDYSKIRKIEFWGVMLGMFSAILLVITYSILPDMIISDVDILPKTV